MFENFITFKEVIKLSTYTFHYLKQVNYSEDLLNYVCRQDRIGKAQQLCKLITEDKIPITDTSLLNNLIGMIDSSYLGFLHREKSWLNCIFKFILSGYGLDLKTRGNDLYFFSNKYGYSGYIRYLMESNPGEYTIMMKERTLTKCIIANNCYDVDFCIRDEEFVVRFIDILLAIQTSADMIDYFVCTGFINYKTFKLLSKYSSNEKLNKGIKYLKEVHYSSDI